jgi:hypothetical protein
VWFSTYRRQKYLWIVSKVKERSVNPKATKAGFARRHWRNCISVGN